MESAALLVIDVQEGLFNKKNKVFNEDLLLQNINNLIEKSRENGIPIIFIRHTNKSFLLENSVDWQLHPSLRVKSDDLCLNKEHSSIFKEKSIKKELANLGIKTLIITGLVTNGCIKAACLDGLSFGYQVILARDGHSTFTGNPQELIEEWNEKLSQEGVHVILTKDIFSE